jgi:hypothetical protein
MADNIFGRPVFYRYADHVALPSVPFGFQPASVGKYVILLKFSPADAEMLSDPTTEPVGMYHYAGTRRYVWRELEWGEVDWSRKVVYSLAEERLRGSATREEAALLRKAQELIALCGAGAPSPTDVQEPLDTPFTRVVSRVFNISLNDFVMESIAGKSYCRAIYRVNSPTL